MAQTYKTGLIITGDASGGIRAIKATDDELGKLNQGFDRGSRRSRQFNQDVNATSQGLGVLRRAAAPIAGVIAGMFAANTLQSQIDWGDQLQKTNLRIGASTEALSQYSYVAKLSGVEFGQLTTAWQRQTRRIAEAAAGTGVAVAALDRLNLSAQELNQLAPEDQFERIAEAMQGVENSSERVRLAQQLWDSEGVKLVQIVNQGTGAMAAMRAEADALGLTISQDTANAMASYNDEVDRLKFAAQGVSQTLLAELVPAMTAGLQETNAFIQQVGGAEVVVGHLIDGGKVLAALMAGRYAGAFATATAAKLAATQQSIAYQMALARMAGVSTTAAAAQTALAGATRAASGALALVGGPVGAAVVAAGAIYYFREELGLVERPAITAAGAVDELALRVDGAADSMLKFEVAAFTAELVSLQTAAQQAEENLARLERTASEPYSYGQGQQGDLTAGADRQRAQLESINNQINAREEAITKLTRRIEEMNAADADSEDIKRELQITIDGLTDSTEKAVDKTTTLANSYENLLDRIQPNRRAARQYAQDVGTLNLALATGRMTTVQYMQAMGMLQESFQASQRETGNVVKEVTEQNNQAAQDLGFAFESAFENAIIQGEGLRSVLGGIAQDIARITLRQTVTAPIGNWVSGAVGGLFGGFSEGGYTGAGGRLEPAGIVHRGEFVVQKSVVERPGVRPMLEALNQGVAAQFANGGYVVPDSPPAIPTLGLSQGYADGGYVSSPGPVSLERFNQHNHTSQQNVSFSVSVPVTVHAAPGMNQEQAQQQGQTIGQAVEGAVVRVLQKQMRPGGLLYRK
ncbi:hypothetical protein [Halomonas sp. BMC6]|uniref:hypothetical protein n=1 Tax=Halomonas sp. BMC6 TaxID=3073244 RepID=UPI0030D4331D